MRKAPNSVSPGKNGLNGLVGNQGNGVVGEKTGSDIVEKKYISYRKGRTGAGSFIREKWYQSA
jgi:hypothetical protein